MNKLARNEHLRRIKPLLSRGSTLRITGYNNLLQSDRYIDIMITLINFKLKMRIELESRSKKCTYNPIFRDDAMIVWRVKLEKALKKTNAQTGGSK